MLDIKFIRENPELIKEAARKKHVTFNVHELLEVDDTRKALLKKVEEMRARQNEYTDHIAKTDDQKERERMIVEMRELKAKLQTEEKELEGTMRAWRLLMLQVPNIPDMAVPEGDSDEKNQEIKTWGAVPKFSFSPKNHVALLEALGLLDLERGAKVSGFRGYFLKKEGVLLNFAIWQFAYEHFLSKGEFIPVMAPSLVRREALFGTGYLPQGEDDLYVTQDGEYLSGTSEVPIMGYHMDDVLSKSELPKKFLGFSVCFRREAGSHGKDTKGIMRVHEFYKFEQVILCEARHDESVTHHEWINKNTESFLEALEIPYRTVLNCGGDLGLGQVKKYDIEAWVPSEEKYREISSASYFHDFQTRRLNIRYRDDDGTLRFTHSLNSTAIATPRILISLVENNQNEDGSITIPEALRKYVGKDTIVLSHS